ncbi:MAG: hypothetical protein HKN87_05450 [Saprospiraceae bacterium]|nr:hypothetical protein [Saprospiraceae bacterium]
MSYANVKGKVIKYQDILNNTRAYREAWKKETRAMIEEQLQAIMDETGLEASVETKDDLNNLEAIGLDLGQDVSGISEQVGAAKRNFIKSKGTLIYQQLFNGKIMITISYPFIEGLGQPKQPKMIEILRPEELEPPFILRHVEEFFKEIIAWEDYDDDVPGQPIGFQTNLTKEIITNPDS